MALISCDECGHRISDKSIFCPNCGYPTHLNKALRERQTDAAEGSPADSSAASLTETPDAAVETILATEAKETKGTEAKGAKANDTKGNNGSEEILYAKVAVEPIFSIEASLTKDAKESKEAKVAKEAKEAKVAKVAKVAIASTETAPAGDALAEYEATLSHPRSPKSNNRMKLVLYFAVLIVLLAAVFLCYYYAKSNHLGSIDEVQCEPIDETLVEAPDAGIVEGIDASATLADDSVTTVGADSISTLATDSVTVVASPAVRQL